MERHKFYVEIGEYKGWGTWNTNSQDQFETIVECRSPQDGERMVQAQYGGKERCRVNWRGPA
jgi:hypothetical protein